jgi:hypothetical protein
MKLFIQATFLFTLISSLLISQNFTVKGVIIDSTDGLKLPGASISLFTTKEEQPTFNILSGNNGEFEFPLQTPGRFYIHISFVGYIDFADSVIVTRNKAIVDLGNIKLKRSPLQMKEVDITGTAISAGQNEDTLSFAAKAYKTNPDATAEDLITKLPGVQKEEGTIKAQGEEVKQVLVDGQPFFGEDPAVTLKNLPADLIEKIEIFDKLSDQARFTGFDDGQTSKTINIVTKRDRRNGQFGKLYGGYGSTEKFQSGGTVNLFTEGRRFSILGLANNVNMQNFSQQDLLGITQGGGGGHRDDYQGRGHGGGGGGPQGGGGHGGGNAANNFLTSNLNGNTKTYSIGLNYQENWGKKATLSGSYFFNNTNNNNDQIISREYFATNSGQQFYDEISSSLAKNFNHRLNFRFEYNIDTMNTFLFTPKLTVQSNETNNIFFGKNSYGITSNRMSSTDNINGNNGSGYSFNNELIYRMRFATIGRSISFTLNSGVNNKTIDRTQYSLNKFVAAYSTSTTDTIDQKGNDLVRGYNFNGNIVYTEPVGKFGQLQATLSGGLTNNFSDKQTYNFDGIYSIYDILDSISTNKYDNNYYTYRGGLAYRFRNEDLQINLGINYQLSKLNGDQTFPSSLLTEKKYNNFLPSLRFNFKISENQNLRLFYNANVNAPTITQLQNYYDVTNPLFIRAGNPDLKEDFSHRMSLQYLTTDKPTGANFFAMAFYQITKDYVGNSSFTATKDTVIGGNVILKRGSQFSNSKNFDNSQNFRAMLSGGLPINLIKSNVSLSFNFGYQTLPSEYQSVVSVSKIYSFNQSISAASNISENIDFRLTYSPSYYISKNEILPNTDDDYFVHSATANLYVNVFDLFFVRTDYALYNTSGIANNGDVSFSLWNAGIGIKLFTDERAELRLDVFDILNENSSFLRTATDIYIENKTTQVLRQYLMLSFTYNLRAF